MATNRLIVSDTDQQRFYISCSATIKTRINHAVNSIICGLMSDILSVLFDYSSDHNIVIHPICLKAKRSVLERTLGNNLPRRKQQGEVIRPSHAVYVYRLCQVATR